MGLKTLSFNPLLQIPLQIFRLFFIRGITSLVIDMSTGQPFPVPGLVCQLSYLLQQIFQMHFS